MMRHWCWQTLRLLGRRICLYGVIVGRRWTVGRLGPWTAWQVVQRVLPWEDRWNGALDGRKGETVEEEGTAGNGN